MEGEGEGRKTMIYSEKYEALRVDLGPGGLPVSLKVTPLPALTRIALWL